MKFVLIGDPAVRLAYPEFGTKTLKINSNIVVDDIYDTINALSQVKIEGIVTDENNNQMLDFQGIMYPTVYDKKVEIETLPPAEPPNPLPERGRVRACAPSTT